jgi:uncharacterized protein YPO0396
MTKQEIAAAKAQRLMILGAMTEMTVDERRDIQDARAEFRTIADKNDEVKLGMMLTFLDLIVEGVFGDGT